MKEIRFHQDIRTNSIIVLIFNEKTGYKEIHHIKPYHNIDLIGYELLVEYIKYVELNEVNLRKEIKELKESLLE